MSPGAVPAVDGPVLRRPCPPRRDLPTLPTLPPTPPAWLAAPPAPVVCGRLAYERIKAGTADSRERAVACAVAVYAVWFVVTRRPWVPDLLTASVWATAVVYGLGTIWLCRAGTPPWRWTVRRSVAATAVVGVLGAIWLLVGNLPAVLLLALAAAQFFAYRPDAVEAVDGRWHSHASLVSALTAAGVLPKRTEEPWTLRYRGKLARTEFGESITVELPAGFVHRDVEKHRERLAGALGFAPRRLWLDHDPDDSPRCVTIGVATSRTGVVPSPLGDRDRTVWHEPFRLGLDVRGQVVERTARARNRIVGGVMGFGKTVELRKEVLTFALDPSTTILGCDGKGSRDDYEDVQAIAHAWVWGTDEDPAPPLLEMLRFVLRVVHWRNSQRRPDGGWPGVLLLLEELQEIRAAASKDDRDEIDKVLGRVIRLGRAVDVVVVIATQRPTAEDIPTGVRNLVAEATCLKVRGVEDARIVLGDTPVLTLPAKPGEGIVADERGQRAVDLDLVSLDVFRDRLRVAAALRAAEPPLPLLLTDAPAEPSEALDPFAAAVLAALEAGPMTPSALRESVAPDMTAHTFGRRVKLVPGVEAGSGGSDGKSRVYRRADRRADALRASDSPIHAQTGTSAVDLSEASVLP